MSDPSETPSWAAAEPPIGEEKPKKCSLPGFLDGGAEKDETKLGENELAAKHLCKFVGVFWSTKHTKWQAGWKCLNINCGVIFPSKPSGGYSNHRQHFIGSKCLGAQGFEEKVKELREQGNTKGPQRRPNQFFQSVSKQDKDRFGWLRLIIEDNQPISIVEKPLWRESMKFEHTFAIKTISKVIANLTVIVEQRIKLQLGEVFALAFDGWSKLIALRNGGDKDKSLQTALLGVSPMEGIE